MPVPRTKVELIFPKRLSFANIPTRIEKLRNLTRKLGGPDIFVKRDDLTGCILSGNKVRKLDFLVAEALAQKADTLITCGAAQSNHARATSIVARRVGLGCTLVLRSEDDNKPDGNLFIDRLARADIRFVSSEEYRTVEDVMEGIAQELRQKGRRPYVIPGGGSNELGAMGYVEAIKEIKGQLQQSNLKIDYIITASSSGGTLAGLLIGAKLFPMGAKIIGIDVSGDADYARGKVHGIIQRAIARFNLDISIGIKEIELLEDYAGRGYGLNTKEEIDFIKLVAQEEGIILDPVYTGKAMYGVAREIQAKTFKKGENLLFIHTGGLFAIFARKEEFLKARDQAGSGDLLQIL